LSLRLRIEGKLKDLFSKDRMRIEEIRIAKKDRKEKTEEVEILREKLKVIEEDYN